MADKYISSILLPDENVYILKDTNAVKKSGDTMTGTLKFSGNNSRAIVWEDGTWWQRILTTDDSTSNTAVFTFQQSSNSGSTWEDLLTIKDNGTIVADTFLGKITTYSTPVAITHNYILMTTTTPSSTATGTAVTSSRLWVNAADKGKFELVLGNNTATTTSGGLYGQLALYSASTAGTYLKAADGTAWSTATLQAKTGTIALTSDIPTNLNQLTNGPGYVTSSGVTSLTIITTSPISGGSNTATTSTGTYTISLSDGYGDTKNPYASKTKNYVLAAPSNANGTPSFRALVAADIPDISGTYVTLTTALTISGTKTFSSNIVFSKPTAAGQKHGFTFSGVTDSASLYYFEPSLSDDGRMRFVMTDNDTDPIEMAWSLYRASGSEIPGEHVVHTFNARGHILTPITEKNGTVNTVYVRPGINNVGTIGTSDYKWNAVYATTLYGTVATSLLSGLVAIANGGTGASTALAALVNLFTNSTVTEASGDFTDSTIMITSNNSGSTADWYRRSGVKIWNYIKGKADSIYATLTTVNGLLAAADAMIFKGTLGTGGTITAVPNGTSGKEYQAGYTYKIITAGTYAGIVCEIGDLLIATADSTSGQTAVNNAHWAVAQTNIDGAVTGPTSNGADGNIVVFSGTSGRLIKDSAKAFSTATPSSSSTDAQIPTAKAVWAAINALDVSNITGFGAGKTLATLTESDGKISATFLDISITKSQISDFPNRAGSDSDGGAANSLKNFLVSTTSSLGLEITTNSIGYVSGLTKGGWNNQLTDGAIYGQFYNASWKHEIYGDYRSGHIAIRGKNNGTWQDWLTVLDSGNTYAANSNGAVVSVARNTDTTIATINGVAVKIKIPASDNTWRPIGTGANDAMAGNTNVNNVSQGTTTTSNWRKILLSGQDYAAYNTAVGNDLNTVTYRAVGVSVLPSTGSMRIGGTFIAGAGMEIYGHIAGDTNTTGHGAYSGGGYHSSYNNIILHGDPTTGTSGLLFISDKGTTNINLYSDRAFIQWHAHGVTTFAAEGTAPTLATTGEANQLIIGVGNDSNDLVRIQTPDRLGLLHLVGASGYVIPDTGNTTGNVGSSTGPVYINGGVITACTTYADAEVKNATVWKTGRTLTIGAKGNTIDGSADVSYTAYDMRLVRALYNTDSNPNAFALHGHAIGMISLSDNGDKDNPGGKTGWHHIFLATWTDTTDNNNVTTNEWCTQIMNLCGTTNLYVRSRNGGTIVNGAAWGATWTLILTANNFNSYAPKLDGTGATGNWNIIADKANKDGDGNTITSYYCTLSTALTISGAKIFTGNLSWGTSGAGGYLNGSATDGGINSIRVGNDVWLGDCNSSGILGMKSTATNCGFYFYKSDGTLIGQLYANGSSQIYSNCEIRSGSANGFRLSNGNYGVILRNDGSDYYFLVTASGSAATGSWNSLRPFSFNLGTGNVTLGHRVFIPTDSDVTTNSGTGSLVIGSTTGLSIGIDANEIMCRSSNAASTLYIQNEGGAVQMGAPLSVSSTITASNTIHANGGYLKSTLNGNTLSIGSANDTWCHFSSGVKYHFNPDIWAVGGFHVTNTAGADLGANYTQTECTVNNTNGKIGIYSSTNRGLYEYTDGKWIVYLLHSDDTVRFGYNAYVHYASNAGNSDTVDNLHAADFVRAYGTTNDNIDSDWGQSYKTFDPIPTGTPPALNPNISTINIGNNFNRRKQLAFLYSTDDIFYRRRVDGSWKSWVSLITSANIGSQSVNYATSAGSATKVGIASIWIYPEAGNEINFGGTSTTLTDIYIGYRSKDSRSVPTKFIFGGSTGTADIRAAKLIGGSGNFTLLWNTADSSIDFIFA